MRTETATRPPARRPAERPHADRPISARGMPLAVTLFLVSLMVPIILYVGPLRLLPHRIYLLFVFLPLLMRLVSGQAGRMVATDYLVAGSVLWAALAIFVSQPGPGTIEPIGIHAVEVFGAYLVGRVAIRSAEEFRRFVKVFFGLVLVLIPFAALESMLHRAILLELIPMSHWIVDGGGPRFGLRRAQTVFAHPILFGAFVSTGLGLCWYALKPSAGFVTRSAIAAAVLVATFFSLSSGAIVAFVIQSGMIAWDVLFRRMPGHWKIFGWCAALGYIVIDFASNRTPFHLLVDYATFSSTTGYYRIVIWRWGIDNVLANPIFGLGLNIDQWERAGWMHGSIDNFWLMVAMQYGVPSFLLLAAGIFMMMRQATKAALADPVDQACRTGHLISLAGIIVAGGTVHLWHAAVAFIMFLIGAGVWMGAGTAAEPVAEDRSVAEEKEGARARPPRPKRDRTLVSASRARSDSRANSDSRAKPDRPRTWLK